MSTVVHVGGRFVAPEDADAAKVSLFDGGYLLGDGVFATLRGYEGRCFRVGQHLRGLSRGAATLGLGPLPGQSELADLADEAALRTGASDAYVRVTVTRGPGGAPTLSIIARPYALPSAESYALGVATFTVAPRRVPPACMDGTLKTTSYLGPVLARREAEARGGFEGIQLALDGSVACGTMANLFLVTGDELATPPLATGCRAGITRGALLELAAGLGLRARERPIRPPELLAGGVETFLASTRVECLPVRSVDGDSAGRAAGGFPRTTAIRAAFRELVTRERAADGLRGAER